jgi:hypothetical protein
MASGVADGPCGGGLGRVNGVDVGGGRGEVGGEGGVHGREGVAGAGGVDKQRLLNRILAGYASGMGDTACGVPEVCSLLNWDDTASSGRA